MSAALPLLILGFPIVGAVLLAGRGWRWPRTLTKLVGPGAVWLSFLVVLAAFYTSSYGDFTYWRWIKSGPFDVPMNLQLDHLSLFMCLVITGVGALITTYAVGYMGHEDDPSYARFFCYMDVFVFSMLLLVLAGNFVFLIVGWAGVGLSSYLLIGFYYWRPSAVVAARKAFVMNVVGDVGMILGTFVLFFQVHATTYSAVFKAIPKQDSGALELAAFLFLVGAIAKSAQIPLHTWLPDAMEGPTPVSALIHAATMVTAGVYLVGRLHPLYDVAIYAHAAVALIGAVSALVAASIAIVQTDIKRVLAYSTMSQIGYMFVAVGIGAYSAAFFHLLAHAFFKALLFMSAGNVIHAMDDNQDMRVYGGLWRQLRPTSISFLVGSLALVGVIPFVGFWSKELILGSAFSAGGNPVAVYAWGIGFLTALLTGFYTGRMWWLAFWGQPSERRPVAHPHEAPRVMLVPVIVLAVLSTVGGFIQTTALGLGPRLVDDFLAPVVGVFKAENPFALVLGITTMLLAALLFLTAYLFYVPLGERVAGFWDRLAEVSVSHPRPWSARFPRLQLLLERKLYFDELYDAVFVRPLDWLAVEGERFFDVPVVEGSLSGVATLVQDSAGGLSWVENGFFRRYALVFMGGAVLAGLLLVFIASRG